MTIQERLRTAPWMDHKSLVGEAADHIDALEAKLETATEAAETYRKAMMELTAMLVESRQAGDDAAMAHKVERDALAAEVARLDAGWHKANGDTLDAALERDALMEKVDALTIAAKPALAAMNSINVNCENFHHRKKDQHEPGAECKPRLRYLVAFSALEKAIAAQGNV